MAYTKYSLTPANNNAAPPDGAPEGMLPSAVNDTMRDMMAQIRDVGDGIRGGTYTMTAPVITGGSINGTTVGAGTASTGAFTTLGATGVATFSAGSVSAPAITTTGDTNTGIFFPAADTIAFTEGGAESMRIDSSGNVGIGTSSPIAKSSGVTLTIGNSGSATQPYLNLARTRTGGYYAGVQIYNGASISSYMQEDGDGNLLYGTANTERMRIDSSGNVGIGTSSPIGRLDVETASVNYTNISATNAGNATVLSLLGGTSSEQAICYNANSLRFGTVTGKNAAGFTERMRIDSSGNLLLGRTNNPNSVRFAVAGGNVSFYDANDGQGLQFIRNKGVGTSGSSGFALSYNTVNYTPASASSNIYWDGNTGYFTLSTSSKKYKRNITPVTNEQLDKALQLQPSYYQRLEYDYWEYGFIAEQVQEIGLDEFVAKVEGEVSGLNYEKMVTLAFGLIQRQEKAIQEQQAMIENLTTRLNALEGK